MGYIGQAPTKVPLTSADIADGSIALADMAANSVDSDQYVDGSIDAVHLSANSVDSDAYVDGSIDNAHLANNAVGLDEMAGNTDGVIITFDASGDPVAVGPGSDGEVLTSTGAGSPPAFEAAAGGVDGISSSANANAIVIDADEIVTMPKQPCFNAHLTSYITNVTGDTTSYTVTFPAELFDLNDDFASNTFTAPVTGKYLLNFNHYTGGLTSGTSHYNFIFDTSNRNYRGFHSNTSGWGAGDISIGGSVIADMDASDTAHITIQANGTGKIIDVYGDTTGNVYTWFSGCLLA